MLQGHVSTRRQHAGPHKLVGCVGLFPPDDGGQHVEAQTDKAGQDAGMIGIEPKISFNGPCGVADVHAQKTVWLHDAEAGFPHLIQFPVHGLEHMVRPVFN